MTSASPSQRLDEISEELENLRAQSLSHPEKAVEMLQDGLGQLQISLKELTALARGGGGMSEAERDAFVEDKLACELEKHLRRQEKLLDATRKVLEQKNLDGMLQTAADAARELIGARYAASGHDYVNGVFTVGGVSCSEGVICTSFIEAFNVEKGGMYLDMLQEKNSIRFTDAEVRAHSVWSGLPKGHVPLRGLLGVRLVDANSRPNGLMMVSDKENEVDFTAEDETILSQFAVIVSLALQHIEARIEAENGKLRLEAVMEALPVGVAITDAKGGNIQTNSAFEQIWGGPRPVTQSISDYAAYKAWWADTGKPVAPDEWASAQAVQKAQVVVGQVMEIQRFDGTLGFVINSGAPVRDASGNIVGSAVAIQDITERKRAEEALSKSEAKLRAIFQSLAEGVVFLNTQGEVVEINDAVQRVHGHTLQELTDPKLDPRWQIIRPDGTLFPVDEQPAIVALRTCEAVHDVELGVRTSDGKLRWRLVNAQPVFDDNGNLLGAVASFFDITERKYAEEALQKAHDELEQRVLERTADLARTNEELLKAKDAAEEAVKAKVAFLANMSHELRTPMNSIMGFTSLLLEEPLPVEYKDWLDTMKINGDALLALINDVLDFSKMEKDKIELEIHPFNLRQRIEESLDLVSTKAAEKGLDIAYIIDSNVPETIISDSARLRQVLANLLSNAVKFSDTGDVLVHVTSKQDGDLHEIHFAVQDTGIGMPQRQMSKLFQPFSQISTAPSRLTEGTGLGLAISKKLVELMGGKIWAESEEGKGSTFIFTIKTKAAPDDRDTKLPVGPQPQLAKRNVLIVEDNKTMRRLLGHQAKSWGMVPLVVSLSYSANEMIQNGITPDVAIIDASMPDLNGIVLAQMIRRHRKDLPLIIMTSPGQHVPQNLLAINLPKPIKPMQLYDALTNVLEGRPIQEQYHAPAGNQMSVSQLRILLAEDNVSSQQVAMEMLKKLGYKADVAANGVEVLQALERQPYDIVLMDIKMPEMDGLEATRIIRQRWPHNGPKIVAITAYALKGDRERFIEAGMDDYISKPIQKEDLAQALKRHALPD